MIRRTDDEQIIAKVESIANSSKCEWCKEDGVWVLEVIASSRKYSVQRTLVCISKSRKVVFTIVAGMLSSLDHQVMRFVEIWL